MIFVEKLVIILASKLGFEDLKAIELFIQELEAIKEAKQEFEIVVAFMRVMDVKELKYVVAFEVQGHDNDLFLHPNDDVLLLNDEKQEPSSIQFKISLLVLMKRTMFHSTFQANPDNLEVDSNHVACDCDDPRLVGQAQIRDHACSKDFLNLQMSLFVNDDLFNLYDEMKEFVGSQTQLN